MVIPVSDMFGDFRLQVFMALSRTGNFTRAADELGISQPAVSQNIAGLEKDLGVRLFERNRGEAVLTPAGRVFMEYAGHILYWYGSAGSMFGVGKAAGEGAAYGPVRIAAGSDLISCVVPDLAASVSVLFSGVSFIVDGIDEEWYMSGKNAITARQENDLPDLQGTADPDILLYSKPVPVQEGLSEEHFLQATHIADVPDCVFASPVSRHAKGRYMSLSDIQARMAVLSEPSSAGRGQAAPGQDGNPDFMRQDAAYPGLDAILGVDIVQKIVFRSSSPDAVKRFVASMPDAVGLLPLYCVQKELRDGTLVQVPVPGLPFRHSVHFAASGRFVSSPLCGLLRQRLSEMLSSQRSSEASNSLLA